MNDWSALLTDNYELTMLQGYFDEGMNETAVFEFFVRTMPPNRNFLIAAGLEQVVSYLEQFRFTREELDWLSRRGKFSADFVEFLRGLRFCGDVDAMPEGTVFFENEPILRVTAPLSQAQVIEPAVINLLHFQTLVASKAVRSVLAAPGKLMVDFGLRRAHGADAGLYSARASYLAGFSGTSNVLASKLFNIPVYGTMAHSFVQAHESERDAFKAFARANPGNAVFLLDTFDSLNAAHILVDLAPELESEGIPVKAVRLDSGDLASEARAIRRIFDAGNLENVRIFASGNLDENKVQRLTQSAPIDGFGIGTQMNTSGDQPYLDCAYKLQEYAGEPRRKRSFGKETWPGRKQAYRQFTGGGLLDHDVLTLEDDPQVGTPLLSPVMRAGARVCCAPGLASIRDRAAEECSRLPAELQSLEPASTHRVEISSALESLTHAVDGLVYSGRG